MSALVTSDLADWITIEHMASIFDRLASGARIDRAQLLEALVAVNADPKSISTHLMLGNASMFIGALADQPSWLTKKETLAQCRWFAKELRIAVLSQQRQNS